MSLHIVVKIEIGVVEVNLTQNIIILLKVKLLLSVMSRVKKIQHKEKDFFVNRIFLTDESRSAKAWKFRLSLNITQKIIPLLLFLFR